MTLRVLVVSDVRVIQEGLQSVLERQAGSVSVSTSDVPHATERCQWVDPDVILFDAARPGSRERLRELVAFAPRAKIVALGAAEADDNALALAPTGSEAVCCVSASAASGELMRVLERITGTERSLPRAAALLCRQALGARRGARRALSVQDLPLYLPLSPRELQIAQLIDRGLSNKEIARELGIETATVKNHVHNLCEKLSVHRRGQAAARIRALLGQKAVPADLIQAGHA
jgi:two-component system, NarL family, nitrate/nitrite response regulator NarL